MNLRVPFHLPLPHILVEERVGEREVPFSEGGSWGGGDRINDRQKSRNAPNKNYFCIFTCICLYLVVLGDIWLYLFASKGGFWRGLTWIELPTNKGTF
jgi:hypothetical protein